MMNTNARNILEGTLQGQSAEFAAVRSLLQRKTVQSVGLAKVLRDLLAEYPDNSTDPKVVNARAQLRLAHL